MTLPTYLVPVASISPAGGAPSSTTGSSRNYSPEQRIARNISSRFRFARDGWKRLYVWDDGFFKEADDWIEGEVIRTTEALNRPWTPKLADGAVRYLRSQSQALWSPPPSDRICLQNGILNVMSGELTKHSPSFLSTIQLPLVYDPDAVCPQWHKFLAEVLPQEIWPTFWEVFGLLLTPDTSLQKLICFYGIGSNGKSILISAIEGAIGKRNCSNIALHKLQLSRFATSGLYGKLVNVHADLPRKRLEEAAEIKALVGEDTIEGERKHRDAFSFTPFARHLFSANELPGAKDHSYAFARRWLIIPFERTFDQVKDAVPRNELLDRLLNQEELSGALNCALEGYRRLKKQGHFTEGKAVKEAFDSFERDNNPILRWVEDNVIIDGEAVVLRSTLFENYREYCEGADLKATTSRDAFGRELKALLKRRYGADLTSSQPRVEGERKRTYKGVRLRGPSVSTSSETSSPSEASR